MHEKLAEICQSVNSCLIIAAVTLLLFRLCHEQYVYLDICVCASHLRAEFGIPSSIFLSGTFFKATSSPVWIYINRDLKTATQLHQNFLPVCVLLLGLYHGLLPLFCLESGSYPYLRYVFLNTPSYECGWSYLNFDLQTS